METNNMDKETIADMVNAFKTQLLVEANEGLPPGFEFGDEVANLSDIRLTKDAEKLAKSVDADQLDEDDRQDDLQKHGQDVDLDTIGNAKTKNDSKWDGVDDIQLANLKKDSKKYDEMVRSLRRSSHKGQSRSKIEAYVDQLIKDAKANAKANDTEDKTKAPAERLARLVHNSVFLDIVDDDGNTIDEEAFKEVINVKPTTLIARNDKIKKSGGDVMKFYELTMPAYQGLFYNSNKDKFQLVRTCPNAGDCKMYCYAVSGGYIQYSGVNLKQMRMLNYLMNDWKGFKSQLLSEISKEVKSNKKQLTVLRWHDSGDFFAEAYLDIALEVARETPQVTHYAYTKNVNLIRKKMRGNELPDNFVFNLSEGGTLDKKLASEDKKSVVLPKEVFAPFYAKKTKSKDGKYDESELKTAIIKYYATRSTKTPIIIDHELLTYKELLALPKDYEGKVSVIVTPEDGDDSAKDPRVINTILLIH
jgi:hypothetical protein